MVSSVMLEFLGFLFLGVCVCPMECAMEANGTNPTTSTPDVSTTSLPSSSVISFDHVSPNDTETNPTSQANSTADVTVTTVKSVNLKTSTTSSAKTSTTSSAKTSTTSSAKTSTSTKSAQQLEEEKRKQEEELRRKNINNSIASLVIIAGSLLLICVASFASKLDKPTKKLQTQTQTFIPKMNRAHCGSLEDIHTFPKQST
ncbi:uncharacterized protein LOC132545510 [Ylistrum balloti]|uniref:uncharacterized protein LOC132545510 n=1 Tax=Ylistrum balloti TaxID=509963 RepID=UPI0029057F0A|nr:uncharacterized protein LOC132545510 [Ylistrum balloti]